MDIYDILLADNHDETRKGFNIKQEEKAIRMAEDLLRKRSPIVEAYAGGNISVYEKGTGKVVWQKEILKTK